MLAQSCGGVLVRPQAREISSQVVDRLPLLFCEWFVVLPTLLELRPRSFQFCQLLIQTRLEVICDESVLGIRQIVLLEGTVGCILR